MESNYNIIYYTAKNHMTVKVTGWWLLYESYETQYLHFYFCQLLGMCPWRSWINCFSRRLPHQGGQAGHPNNVTSRVERSNETVRFSKIPHHAGFLHHAPSWISLWFPILGRTERAAVYTGRISYIFSQWNVPNERWMHSISLWVWLL